MTADEIALDLAQHAEGFIGTPYLCPAGVPSIGFGFTRYTDGRAVTLTDPPMTREYAVNMLRKLILRKYLPSTLTLCRTLQTAGQLGAITDFSYNVGLGALRSSTLRKKILARDWDQIPPQLLRWTKGGGRTLPGLLLRRRAEIKAINTYTETL